MTDKTVKLTVRVTPEDHARLTKAHYKAETNQQDYTYKAVMAAVAKTLKEGK